MKNSQRIMKWLRGEVMRWYKTHHPEQFRVMLKQFLRDYRDAVRRESR